MKAEKISILAPIPGKDTVGIEVANTKKAMIVLRDLFESTDWTHTKALLPVAMGKDVYGKVIIDDLSDMPHLLIAGSTGSGKSVCINCLLLSLLYRFSPDDLRIILIDPKVVELQVYNSLPHLVVPVVTDPKKVMLALRWVINEMEKRYRIMAKAGVRNVVAYNEKKKKEKEEQQELNLEDKESDEEDAEDEEESSSTDDADDPERLPFIVVIIDELADLMQTTPADVENAIARLSAKARAAGIHLIIATQTPRASVITGVIKTNVPARVAFQVPSALDSRVILDENGAENLLGKGDLLYLRPASSKLLRAQGGFVSEEDVTKVVSFISKQSEPSYEVEIHERINRSTPGEEDISEKDEELIRRCLEVIRQEKRASTSLLQRRLKIGYGRAAWVMDQLEMRGIVGPKDGAKDREILKDLDEEDFF
jgi:S-DNA-T family DNA segregation ATPase FtsK/SpoIIIE